jgi:cyanophycin synthetase
VSLNTIRSAISDFTIAFEENPGRLNIQDSHGAGAILDYAHNPDGLRELGKLISKMRGRYGKPNGMIGVASDRGDSDIMEKGAIFDSHRQSSRTYGTACCLFHLARPS